MSDVIKLHKQNALLNRFLERCVTLNYKTNLLAVNESTIAIQ